MGQKVHPKGLRLGITQMWDSRWLFGNKKVYRETLLEDIHLREGLMKQFEFAHVCRVEIERAINKLVITMHAVKPGMLIGRGGKGLEDVKAFVMNTIGGDKIAQDKVKMDLKIEPIKKPYLNAYYVANEIGSKIVRGLPHRIVIHRTLDRVMESGAKGVKIQIGGRINGAKISRREKYYQGTVPVSTIRDDVDFAKFPALTKSGYVGIKVWISRPPEK